MKRSISPFLIFRIIFSSFLFWFGVFFLIFGGIFLLAFGWDFSFKREFGLMGAKEYAQGYIRSVEPTNSYVNEAQVIKYLYYFSPKDSPGEKYMSFGYSTDLYQENDLVTVKYRADNPNISAAVGLDTSSFGIWVLLILSIFPLIGLAFIVPGIISAIRSYFILVRGEIGYATFVGATPTNTYINDQQVMKAEFRFRTPDRQSHSVFTKSHHLHHLTDERQEMVVYLPNKPEKAVLVDTLPSVVKRILKEKP